MCECVTGAVLGVETLLRVCVTGTGTGVEKILRVCVSGTGIGVEKVLRVCVTGTGLGVEKLLRVFVRRRYTCREGTAIVCYRYKPWRCLISQTATTLTELSADVI